jgi:signal peptidase I
LDPFLLLAQLQRPRTSADIINDLARTPLSQVVIFVAVLTVIRVALFPMLMKTLPHQRTGLYKVARFVNELLDAFVYAGAFVFLLIRPFAVQTFQIPSGSMWPTLHVSDYIVANKAIYRYTDPKFGDIVVFRPPVEATEGHDDQRDASGEVNVDFVKRLIGLPGDLIEVKKGHLFRNGEPVEKYSNYSECVKNDGYNCLEFRALTPEEQSNLFLSSFKLVNYLGEVIPLNYSEYDANSSFPRGGIDQPPPYGVASKYALDDPQLQDQLRKAPAVRVPKGYYLFMGDNRNGSADSRTWGLAPRESIIGRSEFVWLPFSRIGLTR